MLNQINIEVLKALKSKVNPNEKNSYSTTNKLDKLCQMWYNGYVYEDSLVFAGTY